MNNMKKQMILILAIFVLLLTPACSLGNDIARSIQFSTDSGVTVNSLTGSGNIVEEDRPVSGFDHVVLNGMGDLIITQGTTESLTIEADDNILPVITTEVKSGVLVIGLKDGIRLVGTAKITYHLAVKELNGLEISGLGQANIASLRSTSLELGMSGSGKIQIDDLQADSLTANSSGLGAYILGGKVTTLTLNFSGAGFFDAKDLQTSTATLTINGTGTASVWVTDQLDVNISGGGFVRYYGDPEVTKTISGIGRVEKAGDK
jgi:hypothetical protein